MADQKTVRQLEELSLSTRLNLLKLCRQTRIHIGGDLSVCDIMTVLWQYAISYRPEDPKWPSRDRFVLSKGHASAVTAFNQALRGCYEAEDIFKEYATDFGRFGMHSCNLLNPQVEVSTGSLGHGMPVSVGIAQGLRLNNNHQSRVYVVMGDGELDEGSVWEAAMFAPGRKLGNLIVFVDRNRYQLEGETESITPLEPLADKWRDFGWRVIPVDGNDIAALVDVIDTLPSPDSDIPTLVLCDTVKGKHVDFMENAVQWHIGKMTDEQYEKAVASVKRAYQESRGE